MAIHFERIKEPSSVIITFSTWAEYLGVQRNDDTYRQYLKCLYMHMVGQMMPMRVTLNVPIDPENMTRAALEVANKMGANNGTLIMSGMCSHPELNGFPLEAQMLPVIATNYHGITQNIAHDVAREVSSAYTHWKLDEGNNRGSIETQD